MCAVLWWVCTGGRFEFPVRTREVPRVRSAGAGSRPCRCRTGRSIRPRRTAGVHRGTETHCASGPRGNLDRIHASQPETLWMSYRRRFP
jgi:hypothetical protein